MDIQSIEPRNEKCVENSIFENIGIEANLSEKDLIGILCQGLFAKGLNKLQSCPNPTWSENRKYDPKNSKHFFVEYRPRFQAPRTHYIYSFAPGRFNQRRIPPNWMPSSSRNANSRIRKYHFTTVHPRSISADVPKPPVFIDQGWQPIYK